jgi:hypothetical protein
MIDQKDVDRASVPSSRSFGQWALRWIRSIGLWAILPTIFVISIAIWLAFNNPLRITAIDVPGSPLSSYPVKGDILAYALRDRVNQIFERARITQRDIYIEVGPPQEVKVDIPGEKFSPSSVENFLRSILRIDPNEITGTLIQLPSGKTVSEGVQSNVRYRLDLTKSNKAGFLFDSEGSIQDLIDGAAMSIIDEIEPVVAANYTRTFGPSKRVDAVNKAERAVTTSLGDSESGQLLSDALRQALLSSGLHAGRRTAVCRKR